MQFGALTCWCCRWNCRRWMQSHCVPRWNRNNNSGRCRRRIALLFERTGWQRHRRRSRRRRIAFIFFVAVLLLEHHLHTGRGRRRCNEILRFGIDVDAKRLRTCFVLRLSATQCRLQGHHTLPFLRQTALFTITIPIFAVSFVTFEFNFFAMVATARTVRRRTRWRWRRIRSRCATNLIFRIHHIGIRHAIAPIIGFHHQSRFVFVSFFWQFTLLSSCIFFLFFSLFGLCLELGFSWDESRFQNVYWLFSFWAHLSKSLRETIENHKWNRIQFRRCEQGKSKWIQFRFVSRVKLCLFRFSAFTWRFRWGKSLRDSYRNLSHSVCCLSLGRSILYSFRFFTAPFGVEPLLWTKKKQTTLISFSWINSIRSRSETTSETD